LMQSDNILVVTNIVRAITDSSVESSIYHVVSRHVPLEWEQSTGKFLKLAVVCTKSESINERTALREFCGPGKKISELVMDELDKDITRARESGNQILKKELKRRRELLLIDARNCHVRKELQDAYGPKVPGEQLGVFCVSNTMYEKFSKKANGDMVRNMVTGSGIPELRRFCQSITAEARLLEAKHFLRSSLPSLLDSLDVWTNTAPVTAGTDDDYTRINVDREAIKAIEDRILCAIHESKEDFCSSASEDITITFKHRTGHWEESAEKTGKEWTGWHWNKNLFYSTI